VARCGTTDDKEGTAMVFDMLRVYVGLSPMCQNDCEKKRRSDCCVDVLLGGWLDIDYC
jgi:hypothetical protein